MPEAQWTELLLRSDRNYFEAGAERVPFDGGTLWWMPRLQHVPAGCVVVPDLPIRSPQSFAAEAARLSASVGATLVRFYALPGGADETAAFTAAGLAPSREQLVVHDSRLPLRDGDRAPAAEVRPIENAAGWIDKLELALTLDHLPDGKDAAASQWTELERRKCEAGYMDMWLIDVAGRVFGSFGIARAGSLLRLKNLVVHPDARRTGLGRVAVNFALERAREQGLAALGAYALAGSAGSALYANCGFEIVGEQVEWTGTITAGGEPAVAPSAVRCR